MKRYDVKIYDGSRCGHRHRSRRTAEKCVWRYAALGPRIVKASR